MATQADLFHRFTAYIKDQNLLQQKDRLLVAVSGGLDSVVLVHLCAKAGFEFSVAHCNFGLRGEESNRDEAFVKSLTAQYGVPFFVKHFDTKTFAQTQKLSIQEAARKLRYNWFLELIQNPTPNAQPQTPNLLLTAHHLDDNIETVAMNFFKGTGISGLRGMLPKQGHVIRPLLFARRSELEAYALENSLQWVEDSSNAETAYTRNFFRHKVLPLIAHKFPQAAENMAANVQRFAAVELLYHQSIAAHKKLLLEYKGNEVFIPVLKLAKAVPLQTIVYEILKPYHFSSAQTESVLQLLHSNSGKAVRSATHQVLRHRRWLIIAPLQPQVQTRIVVEKEEELVLAQFKLVLQKIAVPGQLVTDAATALLDAKILKFPLILRPWKAGDYFYPLGMRKKKKVSRFLIDLKLSKTDKEKVWVLESHSRIAWVISYRIDDRFKVTPATQNVYRITSSPLPAGSPAHP